MSAGLERAWTNTNRGCHALAARDPSNCNCQNPSLSLASSASSVRTCKFIGRSRRQGCRKKPSKKFREAFGHTPLSLEEEIPWKCRRLMIGTGTGALPVMEEVKREAKRRKIKLLILPTVEAIEELKQRPHDTNAILHVTC